MNIKLKILYTSICLLISTNNILAKKNTTPLDVNMLTSFNLKTSSVKVRSSWIWEGWQNIKWKNGYYYGKAGGDSNNTISSSEIVIDANQFRYLELYFSNQGVPLLLDLYFFTDNNSPSKDKQIFARLESADLPLPQKQIIDLGTCPDWKGTVKKIILSFPPRSVGSIFTLYGVQFVEKPNYLYNGNMLLVDSNNMPMCWTIHKSKNVVINTNKTEIGHSKLQFSTSKEKIGKSIISTEMNHMHNEHYYCLTLNYLLENEASCFGKVEFLNDDGSLLESKRLILKKDIQITTATFQVPKLAYKGKLVLDVNLPRNSALKIYNTQLDYIGSGLENWSASWIWLPENLDQQTAFFFKKFDVIKNNIKSALLQVTSDDGYYLFLNGKQVSFGNNWAKVNAKDIMAQLKEGENVITIQGLNYLGGNAGILCEIRLIDNKGNLQLITSDSSWKVTEKKPKDWPYATSDSWRNVKVIGRAPCKPWSNVPYYTQVPQVKKHFNTKLNKQTKNTKYSIDSSLGYPRISADGKILTPLIFGGPWRESLYTENSYDSSVQSNFDIYRVHFEFGSAWQKESFMVDCNSLDEKIEELTSINPDAKIILLFRISAPSWWMEKYTDDVCRFSDNTINGHYGILPSTGSERWRTHVKKYIDNFIQHTESQWYADRIIAYMPCSHAGGPEWILTTKQNQYPDYSPAMKTFFRNWLEEKYNTVEQLRKAWRNKTVTFMTAEIPPRDIRDGEQYFLEPSTSQQIFDYNRCLNESVSSAMLEFQEHIKKLCNNRCLNFAFYGYIFEHAQLAIYPATTGHYDLMNSLNSSNVDGLSSPITYRYRQGGSVGGAATAISSFTLHNKIWIQEADIRTNLTVDNFGHKSAFNMEDAIAQNVREFAYAITRRVGIWYFDMSGGWFDNPLFEKNFSTMHKAYDWAIQRPISWHSPIAVFFDEKMFDRTSLLREHWGADNIKNMLGSFRYGLGRCGTPYDSYMLDDIYKINPKQYKCIVLLNTWQKDEKLKQYLDENFRRDGHMIIWMYAPGYSGDILSTDNMDYMTGLKFESMPNVNLGYNLNHKHKFFTSPEFTGIDGGDEKLCPPISFYVVDPDVEVLGTSIENRKPIFVMCRNKDYSTVFMASPDNSGLVWRKLFEQVGIKPFVDKTDCVYYDGNFLGIHFIDGSSPRKIQLDHNVPAVWDVFSGQKISEEKSDLTIDAEPGQSRLFFLGTNQEFLKIQSK